AGALDAHEVRPEVAPGDRMRGEAVTQVARRRSAVGGRLAERVPLQERADAPAEHLAERARRDADVLRDEQVGRVRGRAALDDVDAVGMRDLVGRVRHEGGVDAEADPREDRLLSVGDRACTAERALDGELREHLHAGAGGEIRGVSVHVETLCWQYAAKDYGDGPSAPA